jgi:hypothetical protein
MAASGLVILAVLTSLPYYPRSLITPRWTVLSIDAPMLSLVADGLFLIGVTLLLRRPVERFLAGPGRWRVVSRANDLTMPVYLWHMSAYLVAIAVLARLGAGFVYSTDASAQWWWGRPAVMILSAAVLAGFLAVLGWIVQLVRKTRSPVSR